MKDNDHPPSILSRVEHCTAVLRIETLSRLKLFYLHPLINLTHKGWGGEVYCKYVLYLVELLAVFIYLLDSPVKLSLRFISGLNENNARG